MLAARSDFNFRTGNWAAALADGTKSEELARESNQLMMGLCPHNATRVEAGLGREEEASRHAKDALDIASDLSCLIEAASSSVGLSRLLRGVFQTQSKPSRQPGASLTGKD